jgi:hypothetical protein
VNRRECTKPFPVCSSSEDLAELTVPAGPCGLRPPLELASPLPCHDVAASLLEVCVTARHLILFLSDLTNTTHER